MQWIGALPETEGQPAARKGHSLTRVVRSGILVLYGGQGEDNSYLGDMHAFNPMSQTWTEIQYVPGSRTPIPRALHTMTSVSESTLVLFGGDTGNAQHPTSVNDTWTFDLQARTWRCVSEIMVEATVPLTRSSHTAVYGDLPFPHGPAIYVYGGVGDNRDAVFRLRIPTWTWERLNRAVAQDHKAAGPVEREQHAAVWWPSANSMVVVGGDGSAALLGDVWQLKPTDLKSESCDWLWHRMVITIAANASVNRIVPSAAHSLVALEADKSQLILWGGLCGEGVGLAPTNSGILLNLEKRVSERFDISGPCPSAGRVMHTLVPFRKRDEHFVFLFGGCELDGKVETTAHVAKITCATRPSGAVEFGGTKSGELPSQRITADEGGALPIISDKKGTLKESALEQGAGNMLSNDFPKPMPPPVKRKAIHGDMTNGERSEPLLNSDQAQDILRIRGPAHERNGISHAGPSAAMHMPLIPIGTPLSGRILDSTEVGHFVSVIIKGKEFKGVLVTRPTTRTDERPEAPQKVERAVPGASVSDEVQKEADVAPRESGKSRGPPAPGVKDSSDAKKACDTAAEVKYPLDKPKDHVDSQAKSSGRKEGNEGDSSSKATAVVEQPLETSRGEGSIRDEEDGLEEVVASGHVPSKRQRLDLSPKRDPDSVNRVVPFLPNPREDVLGEPVETEVIDLG